MLKGKVMGKKLSKKQMEIARMASPKDAITGEDFAKLKELKKLQAKNKKFMA